MTVFVLTLCIIATGHARDSALAAKAKLAVKDRLIDPESAQFKVEFEDQHRLCGQVNARNRMGGYNGFRRFLYSEVPGKEVQVLITNPDADPADGMTEELLHTMLVDTVCDEFKKVTK